MSARDQSLVWVVVAPLSAAVLKRSADTREVLEGTRGHAAIVEVDLGARGWESDLASELSKNCTGPVYALGFAGWDDPDHGIPFIERYASGRKTLVWSMPDDDEDPMEVAPPFNDPFALATGLGIDLSRWR